MFDSILIVCVGNICRSPTAEILLRNSLPKKRIDSAGLSALVGKPADKNAIDVAERHHFSLLDHKAKQLTNRMCQEHDLILVMEKKHIEAVCRLAPEVRGKIMLFGHWLKGREIEDPYRKSPEAFEFVFNILEQAAHKWAQALTR